MPTGFLRAIGHFFFPSQPPQMNPAMGQGFSTASGDGPDQEKRRGIRLKHRDITSLLQDCHFTRQRWIQPDRLETLITVENVKASAAFGRSFCGDGTAARMVRDAPKAFAILLWCSWPDIIEDLLLEGFTDADLPLVRNEIDGRILSGKDGKKVFWAFSKIENEDERDQAIDNFLDRQYYLLSPIFDQVSNDNKLTHIHEVHPKCALPLINKQHITNTGMSRVSSCDLHPHHYRHHGKKDHPIKVAVKELGEDDETFVKETENLLRIRQFKNQHLIRHIAACKVQTAPPTFYVIFPLATGGDLHAYWEKQDDQDRTSDLIRWSLQQMLGVATAICDLHTEFPDGSNCRHGDLKPLNMLLFEENGTRKLVVADLGIARVHDKQTAVRTQKATETLATTRAYEAPEAHKTSKDHKRPRSRTYDVWSLGCVFLEFSIWLLFDMDAVKSFGSRRPDRWTEGLPGGFYTIESDGTPVVCNEVETAIKTLIKDKRCGEDTALGQLVRLIADKMLVGDSKGRCDSPELVKELERIVDEAAKKRDEFLLKSGEKSLSVSVPKIFRPRTGSGSGSMTQ